EPLPQALGQPGVGLDRDDLRAELPEDDRVLAHVRADVEDQRSRPHQALEELPALANLLAVLAVEHGLVTRPKGIEHAEPEGQASGAGADALGGAGRGRWLRAHRVSSCTGSGRSCTSAHESATRIRSITVTWMNENAS